jgi:hypothetical protein
MNHNSALPYFGVIALCSILYFSVSTKYVKQNQQGKAAFNLRNPYTIQPQETVPRSPGGPHTYSGSITRFNRFLILLILLILFDHVILHVQQNGWPILRKTCLENVNFMSTATQIKYYMNLHLCNIFYTFNQRCQD